MSCGFDFKKFVYILFSFLIKPLIERIITGFFLFWFIVIFLWAARFVSVQRKIKNKKPRIIWGPTPILTIPITSRALKQLDYNSKTLVYQPYYLTNNFDYNLERLYKYKWLRPFLSWIIFYWILLNYDIVHLFFDRGFLTPDVKRGINRIELPLLKLTGKIVIVSAYGGDVRYENKCKSGGKYNCCIDCIQKLIACICDEKIALSNVKYVNKYADLSLSMGDMIEYTPGSQNDVFYWPVDLDKIKYVGVRDTNDPPIVIVHASNHRHFKGTKYLISAVADLKRKGHPIELYLVEGIRNKQAMELYQRADIVAEQFIIGWHGYFAVEAMALGKPVVCFIRKPEEYLPKNIDCPIVNANPETLEERLIWLIENPHIRVELGQKGRAYVEHVFAMGRVAERLDRIYQNLWEPVTHVSKSKGK